MSPTITSVESRTGQPRASSSSATSAAKGSGSWNNGGRPRSAYQPST